jgi:hypothetical protein
MITEVCNFAQTRLPFWRGIAPSKGDQYDHDRAGVPRQRASMPVLGRVGERCGKQGRFLRPRRDLGERRRPDREIDRCVEDRSNPRTFTPSGGRGLAVPAGPALCDESRQLGDVGGNAPGLVAGRRRAPARFVLEIDLCERLAVVIADDEAVLAELHVRVIDGPRAAGRTLGPSLW